MSVITVQKGALEYLISENISVPHCFTTRLGGISQGYLKSMNIGTSRGDALSNVVTNYRILGNALGFAPEDTVFTRQTHSDIVRKVDASDRGIGLFRPNMEECDALVTDQPGVALVVFTADCTPLLFHDPVTGAVGAAHAGWRGTAQDIGAKTVAAMVRHYGCDPKNIRAAIGPNIGQCCFETDTDVPNAMAELLGDEAWDYTRPAGNKFYVNLKEINARLLRRIGVEDIAISDACTACDTDRYWSARRFGSQRGSQGAIIVCKGAEK